MENDVGVGIRIPKQPRWSPSPVDLSISNNTLNSPPPSLTNQSANNSHPLAASHLSGLGLGVLAPHQLSALGTLNSQLNLSNLPGLTLNSLSSLTANTSTAPLLSPYTAKSPLGSNGLLSNATQASHLTSPSPIFSSRKQREFIPDNKKDDSYWDRRRRNNEAAKKSREKRRLSDMVLENRVLELTHENNILKSELFAIKDKFGLPQNAQFGETENLMVGLDNRGRREKIIKTLMNAAGNENGLLNLHPQLNCNSNSMINALNGTSNSLLHSIGNGNGFVGNNSQHNSHNNSQNSSNSLNGSNGRNYMSCSPRSSSSDSTSPQLNCNNSSLNSTNSSACTNNNSSTNNSTSGILSINKNMNNTERSSNNQQQDDRNLDLNSKSSLNALYSNGQSLLNHSSLIAAYHEQNGRRNSSDHEEENNINNLNSLIQSNQNEWNSKLQDKNANQSMMSSLDLMDKCRLNHFNEDQKTFGHLGVGKQTMSEQELLNATLEKANRLFEENLGQSNSLPFKLRHKARNSPNTDQISDASSETGLDSPLSNGQNSRKTETGSNKKARNETSEEDEDEFIEVELESDEEAGNKKSSKERKEQDYRSFPSSSDSESEKFQKVIDSKKFNAQSTLNLFRNLGNLASLPSSRSTITAFTPYALNCQLNNAL